MSARPCPRGLLSGVRSRRAISLLLRLGVLGVLVGCGAEPIDLCVPGDTRACGQDRQQLCRPDRGWAPCEFVGSGCTPGSFQHCLADRCVDGVRGCAASGFWGPCSCRPSREPPADGGYCGCRTGCCDADGQCLPGNDVSACGATQQGCGRCAADQRCLAQRCSPDAPGLSLVVVSATVTSIDPSHSGCSTWDCPGPFGHPSAQDDPDPYVRERSRGYRTISVPNTVAPEWNEVVAVGFTADQLAQPFVFEMVDADSSKLNANDLIATFNIQLRSEQVAPGRFEFRAPVGWQEATLVLELR